MMAPVLCLAALLAGEVAPPCPGVDARAHIKAGLQLSRAGSEEAALAAFRCAGEVGGGAEALAQAALAEQALGRWVSAEEDLARAVAATADRWIDAHRAELVRAQEVIRDHLGSLDVRGGPGGAEVRLDGRLVGRLPLPGPLRVPTGVVEIEVRSPGFRSARRDRRVEARALALETIELARLDAAPTATSVSPLPPLAVAPSGARPAALVGSAPPAQRSQGTEPRPLLKRPWFWVAAGTLVAAAAVGVFVIDWWRDEYPTPSLGRR